jgi:putative Mg2+ transporter-C (MgtC) family protein
MIDTGDVVVRLALAALAGAVLGWERSSKAKPAGLRTHMLVTIGAAAFVLAGLQFDEEARKLGSNNDDLQKVIAGVIGGVGFLGAGSIIQSGGSVRGLTTAATIWLTAAIGVACGLGYHVLAVTTVVLAMLILLVLGVVERIWFPDDEAHDGAPGKPGLPKDS